MTILLQLTWMNMVEPECHQKIHLMGSSLLPHGKSETERACSRCKAFMR